jgi:hypothetical protein
MQQKELVGNMIGRDNSFTKGKNAQPISYHQGVYYIDINRTASTLSNRLYTYNTNFSSVDDAELELVEKW